MPTWTDALRQLIAKAEDAGVMVMASSVVGSNSHRKLDVDEFRGFALADDLAPLVFLNGADSKAAQMFTLAHELAHVWLGATGVSDTQAGQVPEQQTERWCNGGGGAADALEELRAALPGATRRSRTKSSGWRAEFKVSTLVALRRLFDAGYISRTRAVAALPRGTGAAAQARGERSGLAATSTAPWAHAPASALPAPSSPARWRA